MNIVNQQLSQRRSIRLRDYDYSAVGYYFVTICTQDRECLFGNIIDGQMVLNDIVNMVEEWWKKIPERFDGVELDVFQIMPNHMHGIIIVNDSITYKLVGAGLVPARQGKTQKNRATTRVAPTIGNIVGSFKSISTHEYIQHVKTHGWKPFNKRLWQRNYYEHIIRNDQSLHEIREYISNNPANWDKDAENQRNLSYTDSKRTKSITTSSYG